jgi:tyrosinase
MKLSNVLVAALASVASAKDKPQEVDALAAQGLHKLEAYYSKNALPSPRTCTLDNVAVRREWWVLSSPS